MNVVSCNAKLVSVLLAVSNLASEIVLVDCS
jgi:hypothetical protein